jgi:putative hemolysin
MLHARVTVWQDHDGIMTDIHLRSYPNTAPSHPTRTSGSHAANPARPYKLDVVWARHQDDVRAAQRLRYEVFALEMGANLAPPPSGETGLDVDRFDAHCEHLLVRLAETDDEPARVVGTYRVLTPGGARQAGGLYSEGEFDLRSLLRFRPRMVELGRACTAPGYRQGGVILMLWSSLAAFMQRNRLDIMMGSASVSMADGGHLAASLWAQLRTRHLVSADRAVCPRLPLPVEQLNRSMDVETPALIKGYLRCGARLLGPPAWDPDFGVADLPLLLDLAELPPAYRDRFLKA